MPPEISELLGQNIALIVLAVVIFLAVRSAVRIVPQSEKYVVERFGRLRAVLGPGHDPFAEAERFLTTLYTGSLTPPAARPTRAPAPTAAAPAGEKPSAVG